MTGWLNHANIRLRDVHVKETGGSTMNKPRMRVTLYLPDDMRQRAADAGLNLSRLLRESVERELEGEAPGIRTSARRVKGNVELTVTVPVEAVRELLGDDT